MSWRPLHIRLGRPGSPPAEAVAASAVTVLSGLRLGDLLAGETLSCGQLARMLAIDYDQMERLLDEAEVLGLVRCREGRYALTRAGEGLRSRAATQVPRQRRTTSV